MALNALTGLVTGTEQSITGAGIFAFLMIMVVMFIVGIALYVYSSFALMNIAKRSNTKNPWLAWVPIGNTVLMANIAQMHWWPILLVIPYMLFIIAGMFVHFLIYIALLFILAFVFYLAMWQWKIFEAMKRPGWWALISLIGSLVSLPFVVIENTSSGNWMLILGAVLFSVACSIAHLVLLGVAAWGKREEFELKKIMKKTAKKAR